MSQNISPLLVVTNLSKIEPFRRLRTCVEYKICRIFICCSLSVFVTQSVHMIDSNIYLLESELKE